MLASPPNFFDRSIARSPNASRSLPVKPVTALTPAKFVSNSLPILTVAAKPAVNAPIAAVAAPAGFARLPRLLARPPNMPPPLDALACPSLNDLNNALNEPPVFVACASTFFRLFTSGFVSMLLVSICNAFSISTPALFAAVITLFSPAIKADVSKFICV